jgi:hypothetical protein
MREVHTTPRWSVHLKSPKIPAFQEHRFKEDVALRIKQLAQLHSSAQWTVKMENGALGCRSPLAIRTKGVQCGGLAQTEVLAASFAILIHRGWD